MIGLSTCALALVAPLTLAADVINVSARTNCGTSVATANPVKVPLEAGKWRLTPTNPSIDSEALFTAWSPWGTNRSIYLVRFQSTNSAIFLGNSTEAFESAQLAFNASKSNLPHEFELTAPETVKFYIADNPCTDNSGGISLRIEEIPQLLATDVNLTASVNKNNGVDLTLTTSAEPNTAELLILRGDKLDNGGTEIDVVCNFPSGGSPYSCTDNVIAGSYRAVEIEYDGRLIIYDEVTPK